MSRKRRRNKKNKISNVIEKQADNLKKEIKEISPKPEKKEKKEIILEQKKAVTSSKPVWPEKVQQILDTGRYEVIGNILRKKGADVGFTLSDAFIASLENPKTLASFIKPEPQKEEIKEPEPEPVSEPEPEPVSEPEPEPEIEPEPEPEKHDAKYYQEQDNNQMKAFESWIEDQNGAITLSEVQREQAKEYLDTVEYFLAAIRKQLDEGNILTELGGACLMAYTDVCYTLRNVFSDFLYEDD